MQAQDVAALAQQVLWAAFGLSVIFGAIVQRSHFCTMGAVSDVITMGDWTRMRQWGMAAGVAMIGFAALAFSGQINPAQTLYFSTRWLWLSALLGGLMFGFGMVLSSGCGSKSLARLGAGNLKSLVVLLVMGIAGFATLKGITGVARIASVDRVVMEHAGGATLPALLASATGIPLPSLALGLALLIGGTLVLWGLLNRDFRQGSNLLAGFGIGGVVVAMWWISGHMGFVSEHPETLQEAYLSTNSGRAEALSFVAPVSYALDWLMFFSDKNKVLTVGIVSVAGTILGSALSALLSGSFRWEGFANTEDLANHLVGALLMGVGGVMALGCTVGQGLSGISTLSLTSIVAVASIIAGAVAALRYQFWRLERMA